MIKDKFLQSLHSKDSKFLGFAIVMTLVFHICSLYFIQGISISSLATKHVRLENQINSNGNFDDPSKRNADRNTQLLEAFVGITKETYEKEPKQTNLPAQIEEVLVAEFLSQESDPLQKDQYETSTYDTLVNQTAQNQESSDSEQRDQVNALSSASLISDLSLDSAQLVRPQENQIAQELIKATEGLLGQVITERIEQYTDSPNLTVGFNDGLSSEGIGYENKSGILDDDLDERYADNSGFIPLESLNQYLDSHYITCGEKGNEDNLGSSKNLFFSLNDSKLDVENSKSVGHIASSEDFYIDLEYTPKDDKGYYFRIALSPKPGVQFQKIKQNVVFLIDRSNSITKSRFNISKKAVLEALEEFSPSDTFNILVFDHKIARLSSENLPYTKQNIELAKKFLEEEDHGGVFAFTELYTSLGSIIPKVVAENEVNTAILLSDGDTYLTTSKQRQAINNWTTENRGKVSLYSIATRNHDNLSILDVLSAFNKGVLYIAKNPQDLVQTTKRLIQDIKNPIGKNIVMTAIPKKEDSKIEIGPPQIRAENLYGNRKYVVYGTVDSLDDFYLFVQGKYYNKRINIKHLISFNKGKKVDHHDIKKMWSIQKAYTHYENYLKDGDSYHIEKAKQLLENFNLPVAFY